MICLHFHRCSVESVGWVQKWETGMRRCPHAGEKWWQQQGGEPLCGMGDHLC